VNALASMINVTTVKTSDHEFVENTIGFDLVTHVGPSRLNGPSLYPRVPRPIQPAVASD
jgi:hypothetical protein